MRKMRNDGCTGRETGGRGRREAAGGVLHLWGERRRRKRRSKSRSGSRAVAAWTGGEAAGVHGACGVCAIGKAAADAERETGPESFASAGRGARVWNAGGRDRRSAGGRDRREDSGDLG